jgi:hypothetical protein
MSPTPMVQKVLGALRARGQRHKNGCATRDEIAEHLGVRPEDVCSDGPEPDGPLGEAVNEGLIEPDPEYPGYWRLTAEGLAFLDSQLML